MNTISTTDLQDLLDDSKILNIIDVREPAEIAEGKIPTAVNIPLGLLEIRMSELDKSKEYYVVCLSGGRSGLACDFLEDQGYKVTNVMGGMKSWSGAVE